MNAAPRTVVPVARRWAVGALGLLSTVPLLAEEGDEAPAWIPAVFLVVAAFAVHRPSLGMQLLARATWWSNLGLGTILCLLGAQREVGMGAALSIGCGLALLGAGEGLAEATERQGFATTTSRAGLILLMVLALADAQTFAVMGGITVEHDLGPGIVLLAFSAAWAASFVLLVRLSPWGIVLALAASVLALALLAPEVVDIDGDFVPVVIVLAAVQILAGAPVLAGALRGRPLLSPWPARRRRIAAMVVVGGLMALAALRLVGALETLR